MGQARRVLPDEALQRILAVARRLSASGDINEILSVVIDAMRDLLDAERATVFEYDPRTDELFSTVAHGLTPAPAPGRSSGAPSGGGAGDTSDDPSGGGGGGQIRFPSHSGLAGEAAHSHMIINIPDAQNDPRFNRDIDRQTGFTTRSLLSIPLLGHDGELIGVAQVLNKHEGTFDTDDEDLAAALAAQAAVALKRGRLFEDRIVREKLERDLELARHIQESSFPDELPHIPGYDIEAWTEPADETGGDTYDIISFPAEIAETLTAPGRTAHPGGGGEPISGGRVIFLMGDATGHGIGPALSVTQVRSMLRMAVRMDADLEQIAVSMNEQLCHDLPQGRFITAWLGELDVNSNALVSFSAGQGPLFRYIAAYDEVVELPADTLPLGILPDLSVEIEHHFSMNPGDIFAVISDGIFEALAPTGELFGLRRTTDIIRTHAGESVQRIGELLRTAVDDFTRGAPANDDRTLILIKRTLREELLTTENTENTEGKR